MKSAILLKTGAAFLILWGLLNCAAGAFGGSDHPSPVVPPMFVMVGALIVVAGVGFWLDKNWATWLAVASLIGLSLTALYSASVLRGWYEINVFHHIVRLAISGAILAMAILGKRRVDVRKANLE